MNETLVSSHFKLKLCYKTFQKNMYNLVNNSNTINELGNKQKILNF